MTKIVVCCDSFKGCLTSAEVAACVSDGIKQSIPDTNVEKLMVADGGEGTLEAIYAAVGGEKVTVETYDPLLRKINSYYLVKDDTAIIEIASASGLNHLLDEERNPRVASTYGTGLMILHAFNQGLRNFIIGLGGSATMDGGIGILQAIGFKFFDDKKNEITPQHFFDYKVNSFVANQKARAIFNCRFTILSDVRNPLCGDNGAAFVFGEQKGAGKNELKFYDLKLSEWGHFLSTLGGKDVRDSEGAGAAGGVGAMFLEFPNVEIKSGVDEVLRLIQFERHISDANLIITGEGCMDKQTVGGKAPYGVLCHAKEKNIPVIGIAGTVKDLDILNRAGFDCVFSILQVPADIKMAMVPGVAKANIRATVSQIMKLYSISSAM